MSVTINTTNTSSIKTALSDSLANAALAATKMATGEQFQNFYEDPTSNAIGLNMQSDLGVLKTVLKGIQQSQSMLYIAESGAKSIYNTVSKMKQILAQAKLGYMTDPLIQSTLSPTYSQLKAEIDRIADSVNFNGQTLINGQGGARLSGTASTVATAPIYKSKESSRVFLETYGSTSANITGLTATVVTGGAAGAVTFATKNLTPQITDGTISSDGTGNIIVTGATLTINGTTVTDAGTPAKTGTGNLVITGVDLKFAAGEFTFVNGIVTTLATKAPTITSTATAANFSFTSTGGTITDVSGFTGTPIIPVFTNGEGSGMNDINRTYTLSNGSASSSAFNFLTGSDLNGQSINFNLPNMRLTSFTDAGGIKTLGSIETLNTNDNILSTRPTDLTNLTNSQDADQDIPLVDALLEVMIGQLDQMGAYETRLNNIESQLTNSVQEVDSAQSVFMNADLATQTENFTKSNVKTMIAISSLKNLNNSLQALQQLAQ